MKKKILNISLGLICAIMILVGFCSINLPLQAILDLPNEIELSYDDISSIEYKNIEVVSDIDPLQCAVDLGYANGNITLKAFGAFPIKRIKAKVVPKRIVFGGGYPLGMVLNSNGVVVISGGVVSANGTDIEGKSSLIKGDIIQRIDGQGVLHIKDIANIVKTCDGRPLTISIVRDSKSMDIEATPILDTETNEYKLGVWVKDKVAGLGTVSYVEVNGRYGALGHPIIDNDTQDYFPCLLGSAYSAKIIGCDKSVASKPGALKGVFNVNDKQIGSIEKNSKYGVFGVFDKCDNNEKIYDVGSRLTVKPGKATILTTVDDEIREYTVDIIKASKQKKKNDKGIVLKVTDKDLIKKTGGIVQGMSGSPIIQNGKVVGALTHVFVSDPLKGYGIYLDWMLDN